MVQLVIAFIVLIAAAVLAGQVSRVKPRSLGHGQASESDRQQAAKSIRGLSSAIALGGVAVAAIVAATSCVYSLDVGEVAVVRNLGGSVSGSQSEAGFHAKAHGRAPSNTTRATTSSTSTVTPTTRRPAAARSASRYPLTTGRERARTSTFR